MLDRRDRMPETSRAGTSYVHLSSLGQLCQRQYALADQESVRLTERVTGGHRVMWEVGRAVERMVRSNIIADRQYHGILGRWECACRRHSFTGLYSPAYGICPKCEGLPTNYREIELRDEEAQVTGSPDLPIYVGDELLISEIKSMNAKEWEALEAPKPDHLFQALGYRRMAAALGYKVHRMVAFLYVTKDFKWGDPYKEFHVELDATTERLLDLAWADARSLAAARAARSLPPRTCCASPSQTRAKACPVSGQCFMRS